MLCTRHGASPFWGQKLVSQVQHGKTSAKFWRVIHRQFGDFKELGWEGLGGGGGGKGEGAGHAPSAPGKKTNDDLATKHAQSERGNQDVLARWLFGFDRERVQAIPVLHVTELQQKKRWHFISLTGNVLTWSTLGCFVNSFVCCLNNISVDLRSFWTEQD